MNSVSRARTDAPKRPTNVSLSEALLSEAKSLGINISKACEDGLAIGVREAKARQWQEQNTAGFDAWDRYVEQQGVPLANFRKF
jgi:antitoxin CcdA